MLTQRRKIALTIRLLGFIPLPFNAKAERIIMKINTGFHFNLYEDIYVNISIRYDYETEPALGAENEDLTRAVGMWAEF